MEVFNRVLCKESIKLEPKFINNAKNELEKRLKTKVEGICSKHGYIKHNSIQIHKIAPGYIELSTLAGNIIYDVYFYADICNPLLGTCLKSKITNINRFGILSEAGYTHNGELITVLEIIIAKNSIHVQSEIDLDSLKIGDEIRIEIIGKKFELGEKKISAIGKAIKNVKDLSTKTDDETIIAENISDNEDDQSNDDDSNSETDEETASDEETDEEVEEKHGGSEFFSDKDSFFSSENELDDDINDDNDDDEISDNELSDIDIE